MVAMVQWLDPCSLFFHSQVIVSISLALALEIYRNRFRCHGQSLAELSASKLFTLALVNSSKQCIAGVRLGSRGTHLPIRNVASQNNLRD
jgi:hypothetical protein